MRGRNRQGPGSGHAEREDATGFMKQYRFQNPHRPELVGLSLAFIGAAVFVMQADYDYHGI